MKDFHDRIKKEFDGDWIQPQRKNYYLECCDCGLTHRLDFRLIKDRIGRATIQFRAFRIKRTKKIKERPPMKAAEKESDRFSIETPNEKQLEAVGKVYVQCFGGNGNAPHRVYKWGDIFYLKAKGALVGWICRKHWVEGKASLAFKSKLWNEVRG